MSKKSLLGRFLTSTMLTGVAAGGAAVPAFAQDDAASEDTVVVTGSRIARQDLAAPSPVATFDSEQLVLSNTVNSEEFLDSLPQVIPSFDSTSNNPGTGTATVSLRGLGTGRTLVLVDGMRFVGSGAGAPVDLNNIPAALVETIDVVTGGASAVYGSDAIAGVVNFILKDDFEGIQLDLSDRMSASGWDANIFSAAITGGGNFADGRGNAVVSFSYTNRKALFQGDRAFSAFTFFDPGAGNTATGFIPGGSSSVPGTRFRGRLSTNFGTGAGTAIDPLCAVNTCLGAFQSGPGVGGLRGLRFGNPNDLYNYAPTNYLQLPQERYSTFGKVSYEINDNIEVYARGMFANSVVDQQLAPTPAGFTVAVPETNPLIPGGDPDGPGGFGPPAGSTDCVGRDNLFELMFCDGGTNVGAPVAGVPNSGAGTFVFRFNKRFEELGTRNSLRDTSTFQLSAGIKVDVNDNWVWDTQAQFGRSTISQIQSGNVSISALRDALNSADGVTCLSGNPGCVAADIFNGPGSLSAAAATYISRTGAQIDNVEQTQVVSTMAGEFANWASPWAESGIALVVGAEYREEFARAIPDSVLGPDVLGFNQSLPVGGRFDVYEAFLETEIPLVEGKPFFEYFGINGAYRYSKYSTISAGTHTYAIGGDWKPIEDVRIRAQFQHAVRAPNIGELFAAATNGFPGAKDPCSGGGFGSYVPGDPAVDLRCATVGNGVPVVGAAFQSNGQIEALFGGNPTLGPEAADTLTIGVVYQPSQIEGLTIVVDFYDIKVNDAIFGPSLQTLLDSCYLLGVPAACAVFATSRDATTGEIVTPFIPTLGATNIGLIDTRGIDGQVSYSYDLPDSWGSLAFKYYGTYTLKNGYTPDPLTGRIECVGFYGPNCGDPTPQYKHVAQLNWVWGALTTSVRHRLLSGVTATDPAVSDLSDNIGMFNYIDVTLAYNVNDHLDLTLGVQNITGKDQPILGSTVSEQANTWPATYDTLGRQLFIGASLRF